MARKKFSERIEVLWRLLALVVTGIILGVWNLLIRILILVNLVIVLVTNKRNKEIARLCEIWNSEAYRFMRYLTFVTNERPFPFTSLNTLGKFEK
jgi:sorbitol-specific phosphotransferase system component IIC